MATEKLPSETTEDRWRTATWLTPFIFQIGLALLAAVAWVVGKWVFHTSFAIDRSVLSTRRKHDAAYQAFRVGDGEVVGFGELLAAPPEKMRYTVADF
jgi:hypothetical protein